MFVSSLWFLNRVPPGSDLGSDGPGGLVQHREAFQILNSVSSPGKFLMEGDVQGEHQRFHLVPDWTLQNTNTESQQCSAYKESGSNFLLVHVYLLSS